MHLRLDILAALCLALTGANAQAANPQSKCDTRDYACHDVINSSQCIAGIAMDKKNPPTREAMAKCLDTEGSSSPLSGAARVSREWLG